MADYKCAHCKDAVSASEDVKDFQGTVTKVWTFCPYCAPVGGFEKVYPAGYWDWIPPSRLLPKTTQAVRFTKAAMDDCEKL